MEINVFNLPQDLQSAQFKQLPVDVQCKELSQQFEAILFRQLLSKALKPTFKSSFLRENNAIENYRSLFIDVLSQSIASTSPLQMSQFIKCNQLNNPAHHETS